MPHQKFVILKIAYKPFVKLDLSLRTNLFFYCILLDTGRELNILDVFWTSSVRFICLLKSREIIPESMSLRCLTLLNSISKIIAFIKKIMALNLFAWNVLFEANESTH